MNLNPYLIELAWKPFYVPLNTFLTQIKTGFPNVDGFVASEMSLKVYFYSNYTQEEFDGISAIWDSITETTYPNQLNVPESVTPRQIRLALIRTGTSLESIDNFISSLPEPTRSETLVWWRYSNEFFRANPVLIQMAPMLGFSQEQLDQLFIYAGSL